MDDPRVGNWRGVMGRDLPDISDKWIPDDRQRGIWHDIMMVLFRLRKFYNQAQRENADSQDLRPEISVDAWTKRNEEFVVYREELDLVDSTYYNLTLRQVLNIADQYLDKSAFQIKYNSNNGQFILKRFK